MIAYIDTGKYAKDSFVKGAASGVSSATGGFVSEKALLSKTQESAAGNAFADVIDWIDSETDFKVLRNVLLI